LIADSTSSLVICLLRFFSFLKNFIYLFVREGTQAGGAGEGEADSRQAGSPTRGSIPGPELKADA